MQSLVRFRHLLSDLSSVELYEFDKQCLQVFQQFPASLAMVIFHHFMNQLKEDKARNDSLCMDQFNDVILDIIKQRKPKTDVNENQIEDNDLNEEQNDIKEDENKIEMNDLPQNMIQEIASFLPLKSYSMFECCNRNIFVAMRTTPTLYELEHNDHMIHYTNRLSHSQKAIFMKRFNRVQTLTVIHNNFNCIKDIKWTKLKTLIIHHDVFEIIDSIDTLMKNNIFQWDGIHQLKLYYDYSDALLTSSIFEFVIKCINLEYLSLDLNTLSCGVVHYNKLLQIPFKHLKHLCLWSTLNMYPFLEKVSNQLETLHINCVYDDIEDYTSIKFSKLRKLSLTNLQNMDIISNIAYVFKQAPDIQFFLVDAEVNVTEFRVLMLQILKLKSLKYLEFKFTHYFSFIPAIMESINQYMDTIKTKRSELNIVIRNAGAARLSDSGAAIRMPTIDVLSNVGRLCDSVAKWTNNIFQLSVELTKQEYSKITEEIDVWSVWKQQMQFIVEVKAHPYEQITVVSSSTKPYVIPEQRWECCYLEL